MMKKQIKIFIFLMIAAVSNLETTYANLSLQAVEQTSPGFSAILTDIMPAVVNVTVVSEAYVASKTKKSTQNSDNSDNSDNPSNSDDSGADEQTAPIPNAPKPDNNSSGVQRFEEVGSGVIIKVDGDKGYIVTNAHVIHNAKLVIIALSDGRRFKAKLIGADRLSDIAVLKIDAKDLKALPFGDSDQLKVGDFVAAIGNPFGLHQTVTSGMVSALHRSDLGIEGYENFIQTDASINPGNSGGALVDLKGRLIGINTALIGPVSGNVGIGLAIPSSMVKQVAAQLIAHGKVDRGVLGVYVQDLTPALADAFNISGKKGALITNVISGSPAKKAGLQVQDVVERANGVDITTGAQLRNMMGLLPAGTKVDLHVLRKDKAINISTTVADPAKLKKSTESKAASFLEGVRLTSYDELVPDFGPVQGVGVLDVDETSDAWMGGLRPGDIILAANDQPVANLDALMHLVKGGDKQLLLKVGRGGGVIFIVINNG